MSCGRPIVICRIPRALNFKNATRVFICILNMLIQTRRMQLHWRERLFMIKFVKLKGRTYRSARPEHGKWAKCTCVDRGLPFGSWSSEIDYTMPAPFSIFGLHRRGVRILLLHLSWRAPHHPARESNFLLVLVISVVIPVVVQSGVCVRVPLVVQGPRVSS